ncbi:fasciclin domain-containing protein [Variovorax sp. OV329]|uniref:fasciclin domain-containing protein n=1 Tax=Variovorax sp. OV329 TaxID=1882825 RepID=UPI0008F0F372|nr:fasciclin domain-containing protein [Variovorax sp. OV329]SFN05363.1 Uncaracterized surface protein containing fasciclin (FAS1) repeats [Variovorax sp. OV329]
MKKTMNRRDLILSATALASAVVLPGCGGSDDIENRQDVVDLAASKPELSIFVEAVGAAGLTATLKGSGPFTVFAPNNDAFVALLGELGTTKDALFADKATLTAVLKFHVLDKLVARANIPSGKAIEPISGGFFKIDKVGDAYNTQDGRNRAGHVVATDSFALNGVLHVVDRVLLPANKDIVQTAQGTPSLSILVAAVAAAGLVDTLKGSGPFTVFAPTNDAFAALLTELGVTQEALLADKAMLTKVLTYHVVPSRVLKAEIPFDTSIATVQGSAIRINSNFQITDQRNRVSNITGADVFATNGVVHVIGKVLLPA